MNATPDSDDTDFDRMFDSAAQPDPSWGTKSELERQQVTAGASELQRTGYYVTIARKASRAALLPDAGGYSILCIDDDRELLAVLARKLSLDGYAVRTAFDRKTVAAELRKEPPPHLILLDVGMGDFSGFDLLQNLRQHPTLGLVPVIMLTGHVNLASVLHGMAVGADGYVTKPFQFDALGTAIETVLGIK